MEKESLQQLDYFQRRANELESRIDLKDSIMDQLEKEARDKTAVITEGPPIYLWVPKRPGFYSMQWKSRPFIKGWNFVNQFTRRLPERKSYQDFLVDDISYKPGNAEPDQAQDRIQHLRGSSPGMRNSPLFQPPSDKTRVVLQSSLARQLGTTHSSKLDAEFNARKILDRMGAEGKLFLYPGNATKLMLTVVSPDIPEVRIEQLNMLMELYCTLRKDEVFQPYSKKLSWEAITETYRHVWLNSNGNVTGLTKPVFHGSHFSFSNI